MTLTENIHFLPELHDRVQVFCDRVEAGAALAGMLKDYRGGRALVLAIPAGGVPVAVEMATRLALELDVFPVSKILFPWTTESGFGAVACDGTVWLNRQMVQHFHLDAETIESATAEAVAKVQRRLERLRSIRPVPELKDRCVILVDDGIAAGSTMRAALLALKKASAKEIVIAIPTAHASSLPGLSGEVDAVYCANLRGGLSFAVANAYRQWSDVSEDEVAALLAGFVTGN